jgi:hypothetical protein
MVALDLLPERRHVRVAGALVTDIGALPQALRDLAAAEDTLRLLEEQHEHVQSAAVLKVSRIRPAGSST